MRILFVCAGNIMRSVVAECSLRAGASDMLGEAQGFFSCESGGLSADDGSSPHPLALGALDSLGIPAVDIIASPIGEREMLRADLALTMTHQQCNMLSNRFPQFKDRCFSLIGANGAVDTLLDERGSGMSDRDIVEAAVELAPLELELGLDTAAAVLRDAPRESLRPLKGVPLSARELMTMFSTCYHQVSGIHDPLGGTEEEVLECARQIQFEVTQLLHGLLALATSQRI